MQGKPDQFVPEQTRLREAFVIMSPPACVVHAQEVYSVYGTVCHIVKHTCGLLVCRLTLSCLIELLPFGPLRPCHLPLEMALSLTLRSLRVSLSQTRSMLAYLQCFISELLHCCPACLYMHHVSAAVDVAAKDSISATTAHMFSSSSSARTMPFLRVYRVISVLCRRFPCPASPPLTDNVTSTSLMAPSK